MLKTIISIMLCVGIITASVFQVNVYSAAQKENIIIYVAVDGNDQNSGTEDSPMATMDGAKNKLRNMKKNGSDISGAVVMFRAGSYNINSSVEFTAEDSGTENAPIQYMSYPGEKVEFVGGVKINSSEFSKLTDDLQISKCATDDVAKKIIQYDLSGLGIENIPEPSWAGSFSYTWAGQQIHGITKGDGAPEVFLDGKAMTIARFPNETNMVIKKVINGGEIIRNWYDDTIGKPEYIKPEDRKETPFTIIPSEGDVSRWKNANHALIYGQFYYSWADQTVPLGEVNEEEGSITSKYPSEYGCLAGQPIYIYNLFEEIDFPGEYYIDVDTNILYFYPPEDKKNFEIALSMLGDDMIHVSGAKNIIFNGISVNTTKGGAYRIENCENVAIQNAEISLTGKKAVYIDECKSSGIENSYIHDVDGGIDISGGDRAKLEPANNYVRNCHIERFDRITKSYNPAIFIYGVGNEITHNEINDAEHLAIQFTGNNHIIAYNEIHNCCSYTDDMGVIYAGRDATIRGVKILFNYFHDISSVAESKLGVHGVYLDDGFCGGIVVGNVFENITGYGVHLTGRDAIVKNNIFVNVASAIVLMDYRNVSEETGSGITIRNGLKNIPYQSKIWKESYPELQDIEEHLNEKNYNENNEISNNICVNSGRVKLHTSLPRTWGFEKNNYFTTDDIGFYDMQNRNWTLKPDAKAFRVVEGFQPIAFTRIGTCTDRANTRIKKAVVLKIGSNYAYSKGRLTAIDENPDVKPVIVNNLTFVPIRFIVESLGAEVEWNDETKTAIIMRGQDSISFTQGSSTAIVNGENIEIGTEVFISNDRIYIPLRAVSESLREEVFWDNSGFISISTTENLFDSVVDKDIIDYLSSNMPVY